MFVPYRVDVPMSRWPVANFVLVGLLVAVFFYGGTLRPLEQAALVNRVALDGWDPVRLLGHQWLHGGFFHLLGNVLFLWVFGNAVCAKVGNRAYPLLFVGLGVFAGIVHLLFDGRPMIGASGAINGIVGAFLVLYPANDISCCIWMIVPLSRFTLSSMWMILLWLAFDISGAAKGSGVVAYFAHLGGFVAGFAATSLGLKFRWIEMDPAERSIYQWIRERRAPVPFHRGRDENQRHRPAVGNPRPSTGSAPMSLRGIYAAQNGASAEEKPEKPDPAPDSVRVRCPCGTVLRVPRTPGGTRARCSACGQILRMPDF